MTIFHVIKYLPASATDIHGIMQLPEELYREWILRVSNALGPDQKAITTDESFSILKKVLEDYDSDSIA